ncbi:MAG: ATP-dependent DNA helicase RecQ [Crocinitomicaceae bacterium]
MSAAKDILKQYWGYPDFRGQQSTIIEDVLNGKDILALLPTGGGKSICYQVPGLLKDGICIVISPLIALMQDQVAQLKRRGINAVAITSGMSKREVDFTLDNAIYGQTKFLYVSPERLKNRLFLARFEKMNVSFLAVDEAHCISEWGYDFRPSYLEISALKKIKPNLQIIALTATATSEVVTDIQNKLEFKTPHLIRDSFYRENLVYKVNLVQNKLNGILEYLRNNNDSGLVYCSTRKEVKEVCKQLQDMGVSSNLYHGGLDFESRKQRQLDWINDVTKVIVCTNAFGMGIDKPNVSFVLHYSIPENLEAYFQEAGRAGRNGQAAEAILFYESQDLRKLEDKIRLKFPSMDEIRTVYQALGSYFQLAIGSGFEETYPIDMLEFCDRFNFDLIKTFNAVKFLEIGGFISLSDNFKQPSKIQFTTDKKTLYHFQVKSEKINALSQLIIRTQMGVFDKMVPINELKIAKILKWKESEVISSLELMQLYEIVTYFPKTDKSTITFLTERLDKSNLSIPADFLKRRKDLALNKFKAISGFLENNRCSSSYLLDYFNEENEISCGRCNFCISHQDNRLSKLDKQKIKTYLKSTFNEKDEILILDIIANFKEYQKEAIMEYLRFLIDQHEITADPLAQKVFKV